MSVLLVLLEVKAEEVVVEACRWEWKFLPTEPVRLWPGDRMEASDESLGLCWIPTLSLHKQTN